MKTFIEFLKRHSLIAGIFLMFLLTWPIDFANAGLLPFKVPYIISIAFGWGIIFASLIMTGLTLGKNGVIDLLKRFLMWRVKWTWYLAAFLLYPTIFVSAVLINAAWTKTPIDFSGVFAYKIFGASANLPDSILASRGRFSTTTIPPLHSSRSSPRRILQRRLTSSRVLTG